jgi:hypothetical protein
MFKIKALERHYWFPAYKIPEFMADESIDVIWPLSVFGAFLPSF